MPWPDQTRGLSEFATQTSSAASGQGMREVTAQPGVGNETTEPNRGLYELVPRSGEKKKAIGLGIRAIRARFLRQGLTGKSAWNYLSL